MDAVLGAVGALLPGVRIESAETLRRTARSEVRRLRAVRPGRPGPEMLIVKVFPGAGEGWARESAALGALTAAPAGAPAPRLVAAGGDSPVVVMTDAGTGPSVADALLGGDAAAAKTAVGELAAALAALHRSTRGAREAFSAELAARSGGTVPPSAMPGLVAQAGPSLARFCDQLGVRVPDGALQELADLPGRLSADGPAALTLADACPDNNVRTADGYVLIDFEEAEWRHIAWDVAYLTVPWPGCWCSFRLPAGVTQHALAQYRAAIAGHLPYVATAGFEHDVALATAGWAFVTASWFLGNALGEDRPLHDGFTGLPTRRATILHRLGGAQGTPALPGLAEFAARLRAELVLRWGEVPLEHAPAFRVSGGNSS